LRYVDEKIKHKYSTPRVFKTSLGEEEKPKITIIYRDRAEVYKLDRRLPFEDYKEMMNYLSLIEEESNTREIHYDETVITENMICRCERREDNIFYNCICELEDRKGKILAETVEVEEVKD